MCVMFFARNIISEYHVTILFLPHQIRFSVSSLVIFTTLGRNTYLISHSNCNFFTPYQHFIIARSRSNSDGDGDVWCAPWLAQNLYIGARAFIHHYGNSRRRSAKSQRWKNSIAWTRTRNWWVRLSIGCLKNLHKCAVECQIAYKIDVEGVEYFFFLKPKVRESWPWVTSSKNHPLYLFVENNGQNTQPRANTSSAKISEPHLLPSSLYCSHLLLEASGKVPHSAGWKIITLRPSTAEVLLSL